MILEFRGLGAAMLWFAFSKLACFSATVYIGDVPSQGKDVESGSIGPDGSNGGNITYAFFADGFENDTGASLDVMVTDVNFWAVNTGTIIPYVAKYNGNGGGPGANYEVLLVGDPIDVELDLNQVPFQVTGGVNHFTLDEGETIIAGFWQDVGIVTWEEPGDSDADYIQPDNQIPDGGGPLNSDATWTDLGREYRFTIGLETGPMADADGDGLPDAWETENDLSPDDDGSTDPNNGPEGDPDGDSLTNLEELEHRTHPTMADTDGDGLDDGEELAGAGSRPPTQPRIADGDGDGLTDGQESNTTVFVDETDTGSDPTNTDSDGDTLADGDEVFANNVHGFFSDPNLADTDSDGFEDRLEIRRGSDPNDADSVPSLELVVLGDVPDQMFDVEPGSIGPDTAGDPIGNITYAFFEDAFTNESGASLRLKVMNVIFWGWAQAQGLVTPYIAKYGGGDPANAQSYEVLAVGDPITAVPDLNDAQFLVAGENPVVTVADGESLIAGFHQDGQIVPWEEPPGSDADYIAADNLLPDSPGEPLEGNAGWSTLGREYRFNVILRQDNPQEILLSFAQVLTSAQAGDVIGSFTTIDGKAGATHIYRLAEGEGSDDNDRFAIVVGQLQPAEGADFSGESNDASLSIRVRSEDSEDMNRFVEGVFSLTVKVDSDGDRLPDDWESRWAAGGDLGLLSGLGDADFDGDTLTDLMEYLISVGQDGETPAYPDIDPTLADGDADNLRDDEEVAGAGDRPRTNPGAADTDGDGLNDDIETHTGSFAGPADSGTDPTVADTDGDGLSDGEEVNGSGPDLFTSNPHLTDTDGDGFSDLIEVANGSDPDDPNAVPDVVEVQLTDSNTGAESWETGADWSDGNPANASGAYTVPSGGLTLQTPTQFNPTFPGVRLTILGDGSHLALLGQGTTTIDDLRLNGGFLSYEVGGSVQLNGNLDVRSESGILLTNPNSTLQINATMTGNGVLVIDGDTSSSFNVTGNNAGYTGAWDVTNATLRGLSADSLGRGSITVREGLFDVDYDMAIAGTLELIGEGVKLVLDQDIRVGAFLIAGTPANEIPGTPDPEQTVFDRSWFEAVEADFILEGGSDGTITVVGLEPQPPTQDLRITAVSIVGDSVMLRWTSVPGSDYDILFSQDLELANFAVIDSQPAAASPETETSFVDPEPIGGKKDGYYRVRQVTDDGD